MPDPSHVLASEPIQLREDLSYIEEPIAIMDRREKVLRNKIVRLVKVVWQNHRNEEVTWESEDNMRTQYPELFSN